MTKEEEDLKKTLTEQGSTMKALWNGEEEDKLIGMENESSLMPMTKNTTLMPLRKWWD